MHNMYLSVNCIYLFDVMTSFWSAQNELVKTGQSLHVFKDSAEDLVAILRKSRRCTGKNGARKHGESTGRNLPKLFLLKQNLKTICDSMRFASIDSDLFKSALSQFKYLCFFAGFVWVKLYSTFTWRVCWSFLKKEVGIYPHELSVWLA